MDVVAFSIAMLGFTFGLIAFAQVSEGNRLRQLNEWMGEVHLNRYRLSVARGVEPGGTNAHGDAFSL